MSSETKKTYIVEDDLNIRRIMELKAKSIHHEVTCFTNGDDALAAIRDEAPDLVLTDYRMPGDTDGVRLIREIRDSLGLHMPIILLTGSIAVMGRLKQALADLRGVEFVSKPFSPRALAALIESVLADEEAPHV